MIELKSLKLRSSFVIGVAVPVFESEFLFDAAFKRMASLKEITIDSFRFGYTSGEELPCVTEWKQSGRTLNYENSCGVAWV